MIVFRHADRRFPFLVETTDQPPARWHEQGDGPVQYLSETPDGAWAEFLRHEGIADPADLAGVARALWAIELPDLPMDVPGLPVDVVTGDRSTYAACRAEALRLRADGAMGLVAPSAALEPGSASGFHTQTGLRPRESRAERVVVLFGIRPDLVGWSACDLGRPRPDLLARVRRLDPGAISRPG